MLIKKSNSGSVANFNKMAVLSRSANKLVKIGPKPEAMIKILVSFSLLPSLNRRFAQPGKATGLILPGNLFLGPVVEEQRLADLSDSKRIDPMVSSGRFLEDRCI